MQPPATTEPVIEAEDVRRVRGKYGFGKSAFARALGVSVVSVWQWENGKAEPSGSAKRLIQYIDEGRLKLDPEEFTLKVGRKLKAERLTSTSKSS